MTPATHSRPQVSVLIPAHNEASYIQNCLGALLASQPLDPPGSIEVLVLANGCTDNTAELARNHPPPEGWVIRVVEQQRGDKLGALDAGDAAALGNVLIYLDADVLVAPDLIRQLTQVLSVAAPRYASGTPQIPPAISAMTRAYGQFWVQLPFVRDGVPGFGVFAMNRLGRKRWQNWPDIIADDTFARLTFAPEERVKVPATYSWPLVEGFRNLVRVRRRQNAGVRELLTRFPQLEANDDKYPLSLAALLRLAIRAPVGFAAYVLVALAVKSPMFRSDSRWVRGR